VLGMSVRNRVQGFANRALGAVSATASRETDRVLELTGQIAARQLRDAAYADPMDAELHVFSQFGEDGIIQNLIHRVPIEHEVFVEFGVADYVESNTRFLLVNDNWRGLIIDGDTGHQAFVERTGMSWRHDITALSAFVTRENIDALIASAGISGDIGLLSVDLDGNDLWVLERISGVSPRILITEYNATFGPEAAVTVPYDPGFVRAQKHPSNLYWGASLAAMERTARAKGYTLVAGNKAGNNAFFVRDDVLGDLTPRTVADVYRPSRFRESRGPDGELTFVGPIEERLRLMRDMPLWDVDTGEQVTVADRFGV